jgi:hypothetical protein
VAEGKALMKDETAITVLGWTVVVLTAMELGWVALCGYRMLRPGEAWYSRILFAALAVWVLHNFARHLSAILERPPWRDPFKRDAWAAKQRYWLAFHEPRKLVDVEFDQMQTPEAKVAARRALFEMRLRYAAFNAGSHDPPKS